MGQMAGKESRKAKRDNRKIGAPRRTWGKGQNCFTKNEWENFIRLLRSHKPESVSQLRIVPGKKKDGNSKPGIRKPL